MILTDPVDPRLAAVRKVQLFPDDDAEVMRLKKQHGIRPAVTMRLAVKYGLATVKRKWRFKPQPKRKEQ